MAPLPLSLSSTGYGTGFASLPHEIIFFIFSRLSVKTLCRFKSVSKPWLALITDPEFIKSHLNHQSTKDNKTQKLILTSRFSYDFYSLNTKHLTPPLPSSNYPLSRMIEFWVRLMVSHSYALVKPYS
ncbi:hypothetical protein Vadar_012910 [Vaccinium darrowii]|uniref:Uncharacterized protein n=1 Tax=Vaccinium darrowii TaxID=229202 RepID=A0ACB7XR49_9ERIC|nr:hypothetical protein Vadar_012910 [Vaccinium darrowii]